MAVVLLITLLIGKISIYNYVLSIILFYLIVHNVNELLISYFDLIIFDCQQNLLNVEIKKITSQYQISLLYEPSQIGTSNGITINFKDLQVKLCGKKILDIPKLQIEKFDIVGITGICFFVIFDINNLLICNFYFFRKRFKLFYRNNF